MRINTIKRGFALAVIAGVALTSVACDALLDVRNPNDIAATEVDPIEDASTFANSAWQNYVDIYSSMAVYTAWFTNELRVGDTFPTRNEFGRRFLDDRNGTMSGVWDGIARAIASAEDALRILQPELGDSDINIARLYLASGLGTLTMAETFCTGVVRQEEDAVGGSSLPVGSPELTQAQLLEHAIARLGQAISSGDAAGGAGADIANAARVAQARAHLWAGNNAQVASAVAAVPAGFVYNAVYLDNASNRGRLGNDVHAFSSATAQRESGVVGPEWRALGQGADVSGDGTYTAEEAGDARVSWEYDGRLAQDGVHDFVYQTTHLGWGAPLPLASELEADYLVQQAEGTDASRVAMINARTGQALTVASFAGSDEILEELLYQKGLDFWLTARRMPDWRWYTGDGATSRSTQYRFIIQPTDSYYKPSVGDMGNQFCWPLPYNEYSRNDDIDR